MTEVTGNFILKNHIVIQKQDYEVKVRNECYSTKVFLMTIPKGLSHISDLPCLHTPAYPLS